MAEVMLMPLLSDTMTEGTVAAWHKQVGDQVEIGELLLEIETDKAVMEQDSFFEGTLLYIGVQEGESVPVNAVLAVIGEEGEDYKPALEAALAKSNGSSDDNVEQPEPSKEPEKEVATVETSAETSSSDSRIKASPLAKSMAKEAGINLSAVAGSGDNGRIVKRDIVAFLDKKETAQPTPQVQAPTPPPAAPAFTMGGEAYEDVKVGNMRKTIARRLGESKFTAPHFYLTVAINMNKAIDARKRMNEISPVKISFNDLVIKAATVALRQHPTINSSWLGDKIRYNKVINIGVAVAIDEGLIVPVVRHADMKSLSQIAGEVRELAGKAKDRKLSTDEMTGNTFTISNLGMFGIEEFTAIINPPDSCIMAVGGISQVPVVENGEITVGNIMKVTLSCDHRTVDGASGAKFLKTFKEVLEDPIRLLV